ncbi:sigma-70 family RNA polymerase sigma factor [bacterium]|nr:sigma-70 family RNA polymerase sigma factor [bacterium]
MGVLVSEPSTEQLVFLAIRGDREAFGAIYDRLAPEVHRFLRGQRLDLDHHRLEDAVQETFLRLHRMLSSFDASRPLKPYVVGIARRVALELGRRARPSSPAGLEDEPSRGSDAPEEALRTERDRLVGAALAALEDEHRALVVLRFVSELTMQDLADALSCSIPTARARLNEAALRFVQELAKRGLLPEERSP